MKKLFIVLVALFTGSQGYSLEKQKASTPARVLLTRLILLNNSRDKQNNDFEIVKLTDTLVQALPTISDTDLSDEIRFNVSDGLLNLKNRQLARPYFVEPILQLLNKRDAASSVHIYRRGVARNLNNLYAEFLNDEQEFPADGYANIRNSLNFRFYNRQPLSEEQVNKLNDYLVVHKELPDNERESLLFKAAMLVKNSNDIGGNAQNRLYKLLKRNAAIKNEDLVKQFNSMEKPDDLPTVPRQDNALANFDNLTGSIFAGIEIGSSAVKLSVVKMVKDVGDYRYFKVLCEPTTKDIKSREFTVSNYKAIATKVREFYNCLIQSEPGFNLPPFKIFITFSSGFCANFINAQHTQGLDSLEQEIRLAINEPKHIIARLDPGMESGLTHLGLLFDPLKHNSTLVLDIGDGNTKGGFYALGSEDFTSVDFALASGTLKSKVEASSTTTMTVPDFANTVDKYLNEHKQLEINQVLSSINSVSNQKEVYFSGGISWVISTLLKPDNPRMEPVVITRENINMLVNNVTYNFAKTMDNASADYELHKRHAENPDVTCLNCQSQDFIFAKFDEKKFIAGAKLMQAIMDQLNMSTIPKKFYVCSSGKLSWLNAFILKNLY